MPDNNDTPRSALPGMKLRKKKPPFVAVMLRGGAAIRLRAATSSEIEAAASQAGEQLAGIMLASDQAARLAALLPGFDLGPLADLAQMPGGERRALLADIGLRGRFDALRDRLMLTDLICRCHDGWSGVRDDDNVEIPAPEPGAVSWLLEDMTLLQRCSDAIYAGVHTEAVEGNAFAA